MGRALASVGGPVAMRFAHEMNGGWYPWGQGVNGNTPADYVAAYRHVHDVITSVGATDVIWTWSPSIVYTTTTPTLSPLYPGDDYVDWIGLSVYLDQATDTYAQTAAGTLAQLDALAPTKPIYVTEASVLPGDTRPEMIRDLVSGMLATPRLVGFTWFDRSTDRDWRVSNDAPAAAALRAELDQPWFGGAGEVGGPLLTAPTAQATPVVTGTAHAGTSLSGTTGAWRSPSGSGALTTSRSWQRCSSPSDTATCTSTGGTAATYTVATADRGRYLRLAVTAANDAGTTRTWSAPTQAVTTTPAVPSAPYVQARDGAILVHFPATAPAGASHWLLTVNGVRRPLIPLGTAPYWVTGLTNGTAYTVALAGVDVTSTSQVAGPATTGTVVPMAAPWTPTVKVSGTTATFTPLRVPAGASSWVLTVGSQTKYVAPTTAPITVTGLPAGTSSWSLKAAAGSWGGSTGTSATPPVSGTLTVAAAPAPVAPGYPAAPVVQSREGALFLTFPAAPRYATHWQLTVDGVARPLVPVGTTTFWLTGLTNGKSYRLGLAGVAVSGGRSATGPATTGTAVPLTTPWKPAVSAQGTTAVVTLPAQAPVGATGWVVTVGGQTRTVPLGTGSVSVPGLVRGQATGWALQAATGTWSGRTGTSTTPAVSGTVTAR
jgi:hypothetical protein